MNSPFANLFLAIQAQINTNVASIAHIDQNLGQLKAATRPPIALPCVLIDLEDFKFQNLVSHVQTAVGTVIIQLIMAPQSNSSQATPTTYLQQAISFYDMEWALHKVLEGWCPGSSYGSLNRTQASTLPNKDNYRVREIRYTLAFDDYSAAQSTSLTTPASIVISDVII